MAIIILMMTKQIIYILKILKTGYDKNAESSPVNENHLKLKIKLNRRK